jgi:cation diffusion facilitator CzcD-associated flavoprotein CzcO
MPGKNYAYSDEQRARFRDDLAAIDEIRYGRYLGFFKRHTTAVLDVTSPEYLEIEGIVAKHLAEKVPDPALREKLTPDYKVMCKRLVVSSTYYDVVQRPDVHLALGPIARAEPNGLRTQDGVLHELDALILATGFKADSFIRPTVVKGRGGRDLDGLWADGPKAYLSISAPGFPNFFFLNGPNAPVGNFSLIDIAERQWAYVDQVLAEIEAGRLRHAAAKDEALAVYEAARKAAASTTVFASGCSSWYVSANGEPRGWPWSYDTFLERMAAPDWSDYEVS